MRTFEERETNFHFDEDDRPEPIWTNWGGLKRRVRLQPRYVVVRWKREGLGEWLLWWVWVGGDRVHSQASHGISETFWDSSGEKLPFPEWLAPLVESTNPNQFAGAAK